MSPHPRTGSGRGLRHLVVLLAVAACAFGLLPPALGAVRSDDKGSDPLRTTAPTAAAAQRLVWTAGDSTTAYASVTTEAVSGPATIVFENSEATGNTTGMQHTLTFDTTTAGYNHDVDVNILAYPSDDQAGHHEVDVVLSPGKYRFFCSMPGHGAMTGELVVSDGGGGDPTDTTAPTTSATVEGDKDADGSYLGFATVSVTAADDASGVKSVEYALDGGAWTAYTEPVKVADLGEHTVAYRATDNAGNTSAVKQTSFTVVDSGGEDTAPPEVSAMVHGSTNPDGAYVGSAEVMVSATDSGSGVDTVEYALDGGAWTTYADPVEVTEPGEHAVSYRATDVAGNVSAPGLTSFTVVPGSTDDTTPPAVSASVAGAQDGSWRYVDSATVTLSATDTDGSGVDSVQYALDGGAWKAYDAPVKVTAPGSHTVGYRATDAAGNVSDARSTSFQVVTQQTPTPCEQPDPSPTVVVGDVGTGVRNRVAQGRCTIDDLIRDEARWSNHDDFVAHVRSVTSGLYDDGVVSAAERRAIVNAANQSDIGTDA